ncbi:BTB/POZ domain and ankyrin repeat-containing protein NPR1 [Zea mays]|uniref:BTB/POZ domain and ankyrin repeat-containing protein NPR1 n=3 Tax=Zea mays TaxID=4577 RepID=A0A1D6MHJ2_MAIZE|nr:BTB/POZ domain and ankyrin repeat-containing protein NPR1 [Zea mays]ONM28908.1 Regulatory protein NPR1 [Zea mays]PWZ32773.1 BTB/POZ domain and ankyrin repeat-containing protein NPR1 [Zea mays]
MEPMDSQLTALALSDSDSASVEGAAADAADADLQALRRLSDNLAAAFRSPDDFAFLADARIVVPGAPDLRVHRCVLCARSPFLRDAFARRAASAGEEEKDKDSYMCKVELRDLLGDEVEVGYDALRLVLDYLYSGRVAALPKAACLCVDEDACAHVGCRPAVAFMAQVLFAASTFDVAELTNLFQRRLLDVLDKVEVDNLPLVLSVANLCSKSCVKLLERCLDVVVRSNLDMIALEKKLPPDVVKEIVDARVSLGLVSPEDKGFPNIHVRRIHRALDSDDVELVRMLLKEGKTNLDDAYALHYAVEHCDSKITTELLDLALADVNHRNPRGYTVLHIAAMRREPKIIVSLLTKGARPSDLTFDDRKAVQISKRLTKHGDYFGPTEDGKPSPKDRLCIEVLEQAERRDPQLGEASVSLAIEGDSARGRLLYLENRVALARILFPMEARVAMDIAQVDGTLEFTLVSSVNLPAEIQRTVDLNDTPFTMKEEHLARMRALSKTVEVGKRFFPRCSKVLDTIMDDEAEMASLGRDTSAEKKRRFHDLQDLVQKAFSEDKEENDRSAARSPSSSSTTTTSIGAVRPRR